MAMTAAQIAAINPNPPGLWRDDHHRYYYGDRGPYPSVTTIGKVIDKSGPLVGWAKRETAACAIRNLDALRSMIDTGGRDAAQQWLQAIPDYIRDDAAALGTRVHDHIHNDLIGVDIHPEGLEVPMVRGWRRAWDYLNRHGKLLLTEAMLINTDMGFGGTLDLGWEIDGVPTLVDVKTGERVYNEVAIQLSGYDMGQFTAIPEDPTPVPLPKWERYAVLHIRPDDWTLIPVTVDDESRAAFTAALRLSDYVKGYMPWAQGRPIKEELA